MKKTMRALTATVTSALMAALFAVQASAETLSPMTGERTKVWPFILGGVAVILLLAVALLPGLKKKK